MNKKKNTLFCRVGHILKSDANSIHKDKWLSGEIAGVRNINRWNKRQQGRRRKKRKEQIRAWKKT